MLKKNIEEIGYGKFLFNKVVEEMKKTGISHFEIVIESNNYIIRRILESKHNLQLSTNNNKIKYVIKI